MKTFEKIASIILWTVAISLILFFYLPDFSKKEVKSVTNSAPTPTIPINYSNFEKEIAKNGMVKAIPKDASILLKFYNFSTGERDWENSYLLTTASVKKTNTTGADIILSMDSKYLKELTNKNLCTIIPKARNNGDLGFETGLSTASLTWKFRSMLDYKKCLGL